MTPNEKRALADLMFELTGPHTLEEIAEHLGCSKSKVARIEAKALRRLKELAPDEWRGGLREPSALGRSTRRTDLGSDCKTPDETPEDIDNAQAFAESDPRPFDTADFARFARVRRGRTAPRKRIVGE